MTARLRPGDNVVRHDEVLPGVPTGAIQHQHGVSAGIDGAGDLREVNVHRLGVGIGHDQPDGSGAVGAGCTEDVCPLVTGVADRTGSGAALCPYPCQRPLLAYASFVLEPDLEWLSARRLGEGIGGRPGEVFLNTSCAAGSLFGC